MDPHSLNPCVMEGGTQLEYFTFKKPVCSGPALESEAAAAAISELPVVSVQGIGSGSVLSFG